MKNCIFCKIISKKSPCWKIYEDDLVIAFLDIYPACEGHTLVVPKKHYKDIYDIPEIYLERIVSVCKRLAIQYKKTLGVKAVNLVHGSGKDAQQDVFHFHFHIIPRRDAKKDNFIMHYDPKHKELANKFETIMKKIKC
jgi:histidine triad (HIT) family protein